MRVTHPAAAVARPKPDKSRRPGSAATQGRNGLDAALEHLMASMRPHVALDWDANQQKLVSKPHQIALPWRYLRPDRNGIADVFQVPAELFQLESLRDILTMEVWKECLSASERENLCYLLPEVTDREGVVHSLLRGDIFHFGNPLSDWSELLLKGAMHPDVLQKWDSESTNSQREFYVERQNYHQKMLEKLRNLKECWASCRNAGNEPSFKLKSCIKRKTVEKTMETNVNVGDASRQRCKRQKLGTQKEAIKKTACLSTDDVKLAKPKDMDGCKELIYTLRVSRKQFLDIKHREGKGEELLLASLSPILGDLQKIQMHHFDIPNEKPAPKVAKFWSSLVENDIPSAHANFCTRKVHKERLARMAAETCMERLSCFLHKEDKGESKNDITTFAGSATPQENRRIVEHDPHFGAENARKKLFSMSESSVTCNGSLLGLQATVDSSTSSVEVVQFSSQRLLPKLQASRNVKQDHALLHFDHDTYLASGQSQRGSVQSSIGEREQNFVEEQHCHVLREGEATLVGSDNDVVSNNNEISTIKNIWPGDDIDTEELQSRDEKKLDSFLSREVSINWDPRLKPGSEDSAVLAGRAESEEVEQRTGIHHGAHCSGVDSQVLDMDLMSTFQNQTLKLSGNSFMFGPQDPASRYSDMESCDEKKTHNEHCRDEQHHEGYQYQETRAPSNELSHVTDGSLNPAEDHAHLFDSHSNGFFRTDNISPCNSLQSNKHDDSHSLVLSLRDYKCSGDKKDVKELRLLGDHRTTEKGHHASTSPRSQHGLSGLNLGQATHLQTSCFGDQLKQRQPSLFSRQEECSPGNLLPGLPGWSNGWQMPSNKTQCLDSLLSLGNQWDVGQSGVQENWPYMGAFLDPFLSNNRIDASRNSCMLTNTYQQSQNSYLSRYGFARHEPNTRTFPNRPYSSSGGSQDNHVHILSPHAFRWTGDASRTASNEQWLNAPSEAQQISLSEQKMLQEHLQRKAGSHYAASWF